MSRKPGCFEVSRGSTRAPVRSLPTKRALRLLPWLVLFIGLQSTLLIVLLFGVDPGCVRREGAFLGSCGWMHPECAVTAIAGLLASLLLFALTRRALRCHPSETAMRALDANVEAGVTQPIPEAQFDALTGLPNRVLGQDRLQQAIGVAHRDRSALAVLHLDIDKFKYFNDTHGRELGNQLFKQAARRLSAFAGEADTLFRLPDDEFVLVLTALDPEHAVARVGARCEQILVALAEPFVLEALQLYATMVIGVALYPADGADAETLIRHAETALKMAKKRAPRSYRFFEPDMNVALWRFVEVRDALRLALMRDEFVLHYQPQIDLRSHRVVGVEALLRWPKSGGEPALPATFIAVAEESGLIVPIGRWMLGEACRQAIAWHRAGWPDLTVAVNLSSVQFRQGDIVSDVADALAASGLDPRRLELELTESVLLHAEDSLQHTLVEWSALGIQLAIDDFGTGYSNIAYLKHLRVDKLKIDRSFIIDLRGDDESSALVQAMIQIARALKLRVLAEGVENTSVADQLERLGCDQAQGYLFAQPLPAEDFERWLKNFE